MGIADIFFGNKSEKEIKRISKTVDQIEALDEKMQALSDEELRAKTAEFKERLAAGETLDDLLVEAFAVVREAADRTIHLKHYRVQLMGGIILHQGRIAEMKTGEGKTLVATLPAYLNALEGKGVHIVTVNDYLAKRDAEWMGQVHEFLGLKVGVILNSYNNKERQEAYNCDITYVTNNELGFDYLRDNMVIYKEDLVQRDLNYAIVDEVDSVLIDEARTPLIISGQSGKSTDLYKACDVLARQMQRGTSDGELSKMDAIMGIDIEEDGDFLVNEKEKHVMLTQEGVKKVEQFFHIKNLADPENLEIQHNIILALRAHNLMFRDQDYVVKDNEVLIVDEFTGRIMPGRRYSDGLHQAIEAKEHVKVNRESKTLATITFQNFFNKYKKKAGMTGTAMTEDKEFMDIYGMDVVEIPTNKPMIRVDKDDSIYMTKKEKLNAVIHEIVEAHEKGQPVLVGTINIDASEEVSRLLTKQGIKHNVLNAKFHELEAEIISHAGEKGAVTIATNMAGRGTDIKLEDGVAELGKIENNNFGIRKNLLDYDQVNNDQREVIYAERRRVLDGESMQDVIYRMIKDTVRDDVEMIGGETSPEEWNMVELNETLRREIPLQPIVLSDEEKAAKDKDAIIERLQEEAMELYHAKEKEFEEFARSQAELPEEALLEDDNAMAYKEGIREVERVILLKVIDSKWMNHIDDMDQLRQSIGLQAYGQKDPVVQYKFLGYDMFEEMTKNIRHDTVSALMHVRIQQKVEREQVAKATGTNKDDTVAQGPYKRKEAKIGRNDPCPCGSGKKYKQCCGRFAE